MLTQNIEFTVTTPSQHGTAAFRRATRAATSNSRVGISPAIITHSAPLAVVLEFNTAASRKLAVCTAVG